MVQLTAQAVRFPLPVIVVCPPVDLQLLLLLSLNANLTIIAAYKLSEYLDITSSGAFLAIFHSLAFHFLAALESRVGWFFALLAFLSGILGVAHVTGLAVLYLNTLLIRGFLLFDCQPKF